MLRSLRRDRAGLLFVGVSAGPDPWDTESTPRAWVRPDLVPPSPLVHLRLKAARRIV